MKKKIIIMSIITVLAFSLGVGAATMFKASDVKYTPKDTSWEVDNLNDAIDDLYKNINSSLNVLKLGGAGTYDLTSYKGWENFEVNKNIFVVSNNASGSSNPTWVAHKGGSTNWDYEVWLGANVNLSQPSVTYDKDTGTLTVSNGSVSGGSTGGYFVSKSGSTSNRDGDIYDRSASAAISCNVYLIY